MLLREGDDRRGGGGNRGSRGGGSFGRRRRRSGGLLGGLIEGQTDACDKFLGSFIRGVGLEELFSLIKGRLKLAFVAEADGLAQQLDGLQAGVTGLTGQAAGEGRQNEGGQGEPHA